MKFLFFLSLVAASALAQSTRNTAIEDNHVELTRKRLDQAAEFIALKLKTRISDYIDSRVEHGLTQLEGLDKSCTHRATGKLEKTRKDSKKLLNECSDVIPATYEDAKDLIVFGGYEAMWIAGTLWDIMAAYEPCLHTSQNSDTLTNCIYEATTHVVGLIEDDAILVTKYALSVAGFIFKTILRVYACLDQEVIGTSIKSAIDEAQICHHIVNMSNYSILQR